jgi:hypothetical protein
MAPLLTGSLKPRVEGVAGFGDVYGLSADFVTGARRLLRAGNEKADRLRILGDRQSFAVTPPPPSQGRASVCGRPRGLDRHRLSAQYGHSVDGVACRVVLLRQRDVLAAIVRLANCRLMGSVTSRATASPGRGAAHRLEARVRVCAQRAGKKRAEERGPNPTDRGKPGAKHLLLVAAAGVPLVICATPANVHDSELCEAMLDATPAVGNRRICDPQLGPPKVHAVKGYDFARCRRGSTMRLIKHHNARIGIESKQRLGRHRWVVERTFARLAQYRHLSVCYERPADIHRALLTFGCSLICRERLTTLRNVPSERGWRGRWRQHSALAQSSDSCWGVRYFDEGGRNHRSPFGGFEVSCSSSCPGRCCNSRVPSRPSIRIRVMTSRGCMVCSANSGANTSQVYLVAGRGEFPCLNAVNLVERAK